MHAARSPYPVTTRIRKSVVDKITARYLPKEELQDGYYFCRRSGAHFFRIHASNGSAPDDSGHGAMMERQLGMGKTKRTD
jgi:hypothetical protein